MTTIDRANGASVGHDHAEEQAPAEANLTGRVAWETPVVVELPKLTELTLQTGSPIDGGGTTGSGGGTVFS